MRKYLLLIMVFISIIGCSKSDETARPSIYLIPDGYKGWVMVEYDKDEGKPTETEGNYTVFSINDQGRAKTKTLLTHEGWATNKYYYVTQSGERKKLKAGEMIHGASEGNENKNYTIEFFFVGTEDEFAKAGDYRKQFSR
ncbi:hypothetical protein [Bacillus sp. CGMCC 1.16541]|uniref:DUF6843 domain-containing protein n=1 Tax=Bacillus sp. CGMCC 1.16541 TaxID=2185143 RepID=UPI000D726C5C|nr:hypothetical protein [Bacillus sp. CGMCC 1.16541]